MQFHNLNRVIKIGRIKNIIVENFKVQGTQINMKKRGSGEIIVVIIRTTIINQVVFCKINNNNSSFSKSYNKPKIIKIKILKKMKLMMIMIIIMMQIKKGRNFMNNQKKSVQ